MPKNTYLTISDIRYEYGLNTKELKNIINAAENNEIDCKYDIKLECWTYCDTINYNYFKIAK